MEISSPISNRRLAAVMFTDIAGYSRLMAADETGTLAFLELHNQILAAAIKAHRGRVVKTIGDAFMAEFASVGDALQCAGEIHRTLATSEEGRETPRRIRIGIHTGEVNVTPEGDLFGDTVNFAARLEPQAPMGGVCVSQAVVDQLKSRQELIFLSAGRKQLKNIPGESELYFLSASGLELGNLGRRLRNRRRWILAASATLIILGLGASPVWKRWQQWQQDRGWILVFEQSFGSKESQTRFQVPDDSKVPDGIMLTNWLPMYTVEPYPFKGTRVKLTFKLNDSDIGGIAVCLPNSLVERTPLIKGGANGGQIRDIDTWGPKGGLITELEPSITDLNVGGWHPGGVFNDDSPLLNVQKALHLPPGRYEMTFSFEKDLIRLDGPNGEHLETVYRELHSFDRSKYWVAIRGDSVTVQNIRVYSRVRGEEDLFAAAESNLSLGKTKIGLAMLDDLLDKATDKEIIARLLYRKAMGLTTQGDLKAADLIYRTLIQDFPDGNYVGYARIDLALLYMDAVEKIRQKASRANNDLSLYAHGADRIFGELISKQPNHSEYWRARWQQARNCLLNLRDDTRANELYISILSDRNYPYSFHTCTDLWAKLESSSGAERKRLSHFIEKLYEELEAKHSGNKNVMAAPNSARRHSRADKQSRT